MACFIGIDVGTGSARAGVFDAQGTLLGTAAAAITTSSPRPDFYQQSSAEIWQAVCRSVHGAMAEAGCEPVDIAGLGFDATCSLVVSGEGGAPISVSPDSAPDQDVILWMDHRAIADAEEITATGAEVLSYVGGRISPEMEMPKLRWLKRELPQSWVRARRFWDLPDWLVHRATGTETRSLCSPVCKWTYLGHKGEGGEGWDDVFLNSIGLDDLSLDSHAAIGNHFAGPGKKAGLLTAKAASELGLAPGTPVASALIDAYAGALGTLGVSDDRSVTDYTGRLALIAGTSTCHISLTPDPTFVPGVWGPYHSVLLPGLWANEGGQSAAGALIDAVLARHSAMASLAPDGKVLSAAAKLEERLMAMAGETAFLSSDRHIQPDFHGNRSPMAEPWRHGAISGLTLDHGADDLALDYLATVQALAYGTRHILEAMRDKGVVVDTLVVSGGLARNRLYLREHADATGCRVLVPAQEEPVLLGSAMIGATAAGVFADLPSAMAAMSGMSETLVPRAGAVRAYHDAKYAVFRRMQDDYAAYARIMAQIGVNT
jgi:FGGY-family pentulose kinase